MANYSGELKEKEHPVLVMGEMGLISSLGTKGLTVFAGTEEKRSIVSCSRYVKQTFLFSSYDSEEFIDELCELGYYFKQKPVLFSDDDRALLNISENRDRLKAYYLFLFPERQMVDSILDKQYFAKLSEQHKLPAPVSYETASVNDFEKVAPEIEYPCILKPSQRHFWWGDAFVEQMGSYQKAVKCADLYQFKDTYQKISEINPNIIIQEYVEGEDNQHYSANLFVSDKGDLQGYYIAQKKRIYPINAGTGTYVETLENPEVFNISMRIVKKLELRGLINIQFKQDSRTGKYKLMEIHVRNSCWSLLGAKAGANLAYLYYQYLVHGIEQKQPVQAAPNVKYINLLKDILALAAYRSEGKLTLDQWWQSLQGERVFAVFSWKDPLPLIVKILFTILSRTKRAIGKRILKQKPQRYDSVLVRNANFLTKIF